MSEKHVFGLEFLDLVVLWVIMEANAIGIRPSISQTQTATNEFLERNGIGLDYATPIRSSVTKMRIVDKLRRYGLIESKNKKNFISVPPAYNASLLQHTSRANALFRKIGKSWQRWPRELAYDHTQNWFNFAAAKTPQPIEE